MQNTGQKFVERFETAVMQYIILSKAQQGEVTKENLQQTFRSGNLQNMSRHLDSCIQTLVQDGHLREIGGNKYGVTDDGREDVQKLAPLALELPNVVNQGGVQGQQRQGVPQTAGGVQGGSQGAQGSQQGRPQNR